MVRRTNAPGIYRITIGHQSYIGSARNMQQRWREHISALRRGAHESSLVQRAFDGVRKASFEVLENCPEDERETVELSYIKRFKPELNGNYETTSGGGATPYSRNPVKFVHGVLGVRTVTSVKAFAKEIGAAPSSVSHVISGDKQSIKGWRLQRTRRQDDANQLSEIAERPAEEALRQGRAERDNPAREELDGDDAQGNQRPPVRPERATDGGESSRRDGVATRVIATRAPVARPARGSA